MSPSPSVANRIRALVLGGAMAIAGCTSEPAMATRDAAATATPDAAATATPDAAATAVPDAAVPPAMDAKSGNGGFLMLTLRPHGMGTAHIWSNRDGNLDCSTTCTGRARSGFSYTLHLEPAGSWVLSGISVTPPGSLLPVMSQSLDQTITTTGTDDVTIDVTFTQP